MFGQMGLTPPKPIWKEPFIKQYLEYLKNNRTSAHERYYYAFKQYVEWLAEKKGIFKDVEELTLSDFRPEVVEEFYNSLKNENTANVFLASVKSFFTYIENIAPFVDVMDFIQFKRWQGAINMIRRREPLESFSSGALTEEEVERLLEVVKDDEVLYSATVVWFYFGARATELSQKYTEVEMDLRDIKSQIRQYGRALIDFDQKLICIPTAKSRHRFRILPFGRIESYIEVWFDSLDEISGYCGGKGRFWFTKRIETPAKNAGVKVSSHTARYTFETLMRKVVDKQWKIDYWLGHATKIPDIYADYKVLLPEIEKSIVENHYLLKIIG